LSDADENDQLARLRQQTILARFGELALRSNDLDEILTEACHLVGEGLGTDLAKVVELQQDGETLCIRAGIGWKPGVVGRVTLRASEDTSEGHAIKTGEPMISPDIDAETRFSYPPFLTENGVRAIANVVIIGGLGRPPFGVLQIDSREPRRFTDSDTTFLRSYANLIAAAVDRLRVIEEWRDEEQRLRLALEAGELGSWELDLATGRATSTPRTLQIFGYADAGTVWSYDAMLDHVLPEDRALVADGMRRTLDTRIEWHFECRIRRGRDGAVRWIEARGRCAGKPGGAAPTHLLGIVADITLRKATEEALRRSNEALEARVAERTRELTEANARLRAEAEERERVEEALRQSHKMEAVGQLTGGLAHDFNNLLAGISGSLELIRTRADQGRSAELGRYIDAALTLVSRAAALTHRLLAFSRRQTLDPKPTGMNRLVHSMEDLFRRTVGPGIHLETRLDDELWPILCDPNQLESALLNLVINARDAMPDGGRLTIETRNLRRDERRFASGGTDGKAFADAPPGDCVVMSVADTGSGMPPDVLARAFDPFFTTKPLGQGTGLGLSMIYGFVQQSGGQVGLRSAVGAGTAVTITLPRHHGTVESVVEHDTVVDPPVADAGAVVLVVEDEPAVRMVIRDVLADLGYIVLVAGDGRTGLHIVDSRTRIDLLLTDIGLPGGMNGRQLADAARQRRDGLKVLFITGYAEGAVIGGVLDQGMQVMTKPFRVDMLAARVQGIISH